MGEVYRATDTNLKRAVAIKVLPAAVAAHPERLARFQREAEVLASLNHPNIAAIYGLQGAQFAVSGACRLVRGAAFLHPGVHVLKSVDRCACDDATKSNHKKRPTFNRRDRRARASVTMPASPSLVPEKHFPPPSKMDCR